MNNNTMLSKIMGKLNEISRRIDILAEQKKRVAEISTFVSLPDYLQKTLLVLARLDRATAESVAKETGKARALESAYLNQLERLGHVSKRRDGRNVYFTLTKDSVKTLNDIILAPNLSLAGCKHSADKTQQERGHNVG